MNAPPPFRRDRQSHAGRLLDEARRLTPRTTTTSERTWKRIERTNERTHGRERSARRWLILLFPTTVALVVVAALLAAKQHRREVATATATAPPPPSRTLAPERPTEAPPLPSLRIGQATLRPGAGARLRVLALARVALDDGRIEAVGEGGRLEVTAPSLRVIFSEARFAASVERRTTTVEVIAGEVEVVGANERVLTLGAGQRVRADDPRLTTRPEHGAKASTSASPAAAPAASAPDHGDDEPKLDAPAPVTHEDRALRLSQCRALGGLARHDCLVTLADANDLVAQVAVYMLARAVDGAERQRWLDTYTYRFPRGAFAPEIALIRAAHAAAPPSGE